MRATVSEKGQVTIPKKLRDSLGIKPGQELDFHEEEGRLVMEKAGDDSEDYLRGIIGILKLDKSTDEVMDELRGPAEIP